jgi:hypothetical protein
MSLTPFHGFLVRRKIAGVFVRDVFKAFLGHVVGGHASGRSVLRRLFGVCELDFVGHDFELRPFVSFLVGVRLYPDPAAAMITR